MRLKILTNIAIEYGVNKGDIIDLTNIEIIESPEGYIILTTPYDLCFFINEVIALDFNLKTYIEKYELDEEKKKRERIITNIL